MTYPPSESSLICFTRYRSCIFMQICLQSAAGILLVPSLSAINHFQPIYTHVCTNACITGCTVQTGTMLHLLAVTVQGVSWWSYQRLVKYHQISWPCHATNETREFILVEQVFRCIIFFKKLEMLYLGLIKSESSGNNGKKKSRNAVNKFYFIFFFQVFSIIFL